MPAAADYESILGSRASFRLKERVQAAARGGSFGAEAERCSGNLDCTHLLLWMARYFFDFRSGDLVSVDDEGRELPHVEAAHGEALNALADVIRVIVPLGQPGHQIAFEVRDDLGPVIEVTALLRSTLLRKQ